MPLPLLSDGQLRPLLAGLGYTLLCVLANRAAQRVARRLGRSYAPGVVRVRQWEGWGSLAQVSRLALAIAFLFSMLLCGVFSASDVGLEPVDWSGILPALLVAAGGGAVWLGVLWCVYWRTRPQTASAVGQDPGSWTSTLAGVLRHASDAATYRGALMPLLGSYWGVWLAIVWKLLASLASGEPGSRLRTPGKREYVFLDWATDWVGAVLYALSGSISAALLGRIACLLAVLGIARPACRRRRLHESVGSAEDQGQSHQAGKHDRGQNRDSLQVT